jgi:glycosyltransferase involved in cell wall biosynthesis
MTKAELLTIGIDATNLRMGGGVTHLVELLRAAQPAEHGIDRIVVWGGTLILTALEDRPWLVKRNPPALDKGLLKRTLWQRFCLSQVALEEDCNILFVPGGSYSGNFQPVITMSRNMLPFEIRELLRFGWSLTTIKMLILRWVQSRSYHRVDGLIFLNKYAKDAVLKVTGALACKTIVIPHGIHNRFNNLPRVQRSLNSYSSQQPFQILYVSTVDFHKHQWHVAGAVAMLRREGLPLTLNLVGPAYPPALKRLKASLIKLDPDGDFITYRGVVPHEALNAHYTDADLCLFASSCENMPNILLEGMASGLPIACSNRGPMPEILGVAGLYFDPEKPKDIASAIKRLIVSPELREENSSAAFASVQQYSWERCSDETFGFLAKMIQQQKKNY